MTDVSFLSDNDKANVTGLGRRSKERTGVKPYLTTIAIVTMLLTVWVGFYAA